MVIDMNETRLGSLEQLQAFVQATAQVQFSPAEAEDARYAHIEAVLKRFGYAPGWENWIKEDDISGLKVWASHFNAFTPLLVYVYEIDKGAAC